MPGPLPRCLLLLAVFVTACTTQAGASVPLASAAPPRATGAPSPTLASSPAPGESPAPTPTPDPSAIELEVTGCEGGVVLSWSATTQPDFHHYTALRSPDREIAPDYPPIAPAVDWGDTYVTDRFITSAIDASILPSETRWNYRVMAYDARGRVIAASPVRDARLLEVEDLGSLDVEVTDAGSTRLRWQPFDGAPECFSSYRVLFGVGAPPSSVLSVVNGQATGSLETDALHAATTYQLRVDAVRTTTLGSFVVGQTETAIYTLP